MSQPSIGPSLPPTEGESDAGSGAEYGMTSAWQARCAELSKQSLQCLSDNDYDKSKCAGQFERYRACLKKKRKVRGTLN